MKNYRKLYTHSAFHDEGTQRMMELALVSICVEILPVLAWLLVHGIHVGCTSSDGPTTLGAPVTL